MFRHVRKKLMMLKRLHLTQVRSPPSFRSPQFWDLQTGDVMSTYMTLKYNKVISRGPREVTPFDTRLTEQFNPSRRPRAPTKPALRGSIGRGPSGPRRFNKSRCWETPFWAAVTVFVKFSSRRKKEKRVVLGFSFGEEGCLCELSQFPP